MKKVIPHPLHNTWKDAQNAIESPKLSYVADFKRTAHSDCMFLSSGGGRGTKNLRKISYQAKGSYLYFRYRAPWTNYLSHRLQWSPHGLWQLFKLKYGQGDSKVKKQTLACSFLNLRILINGCLVLGKTRQIVASKSLNQFFWSKIAQNKCIL